MRQLPARSGLGTRAGDLRLQPRRRSQHLALHDGEVDLNFIEPTGVDGHVDEGQVARNRARACSRRWEDSLSTTQNARRADR